MTMNPMQQSHPLPPPPPPQQQYQPQGRSPARPRSKSGFSFHSRKSHESAGNHQKADLHETHAEKAAKRLSTKADPRLAMSEAEPSAVASDHSTLLAPLRAIQHKDINGILIADPDRSNPTRSRWERPLDTIRGFEAAIDGDYSRKSFMRTDSSQSRRNSYFQGSKVGAMTSKNYQSNGYGGRPQYGGYGYGDGNGGMSRPDSYYNNNNNNNNGYYPNRARYPRNASEPALSTPVGIYPPNGNPQSYETVTTASGSGNSGEPIGYTTDPSSENSSVDRVPTKPEYDQYGHIVQGHSQFSASNYPVKLSEAPVIKLGYQGYQSYSDQNGAPPPVPVKGEVPARVPIKLSANSGGPATYEAPKPDKRKSWFGKRFSRG